MSEIHFQLKENIPETQFLNSLSFFLDHTGSLRALREYFKARKLLQKSEKAEVYFLHESPGIGKTTLIRELSKTNPYIRFNVNGSLLFIGMFEHMTDYFLEATKQNKKVVQYEELMKNLESIASSALTRAFHYVADRIEKFEGKVYDMDTIDHNTFTITFNPSGDCARSFGRLENVLEKYKLPCLAFHFDECQAFIRGLAYQTLPKSGNVPVDLIPYYKFRAFCNAVKPFAYSASVVFCFTGTRYDLAQTIDLNSDLYNIQGIPVIGIFERETIETILTHYARVSKEAMDLIVPKLIGPARSTQIFLKYAALLNSTQGKNQLNLKEVFSLLEKTYLWYKEMHASFLSAIGYGLAKKLAMLYLLPFAFGGECIPSSGTVTRIQFQSLPATILEATDSGFIRVEKMESGRIQIYLPYYFMVRYLSENMPFVEQFTYLELSSSIRSARSFENLKGKTLEFCLAMELAHVNSPLLVKNHLTLLNSSCSIHLMKTMKDCTSTSTIYLVSDPAEDNTLDKIDLIATLMNGRKMLVQVTTLQDEQEIIGKCMDFVKTYESSNHQLVFASLHDFDAHSNTIIRNTKCGIKIWKGQYLVENCRLPIQLLCDPTRAENALNWLEKFYEQEQEKKRKWKRKEQNTKKKKVEGNFQGRDSFVEETKPKWVVIRKYGQGKGGKTIQLPKDIITLLEMGGKALEITAIKVRKLGSEAEIDSLDAIKEDEIVYLTTQEDEKEFK